jgi:hypothetical protein
MRPLMCPSCGSEDAEYYWADVEGNVAKMAAAAALGAGAVLTNPFAVGKTLWDHITNKLPHSVLLRCRGCGTYFTGCPHCKNNFGYPRPRSGFKEFDINVACQNCHREFQIVGKTREYSALLGRENDFD